MIQVFGSYVTSSMMSAPESPSAMYQSVRSMSSSKVHTPHAVDALSPLSLERADAGQEFPSSSFPHATYTAFSQKQTPELASLPAMAQLARSHESPHRWHVT